MYKASESTGCKQTLDKTMRLKTNIIPRKSWKPSKLVPLPQRPSLTI